MNCMTVYSLMPADVKMDLMLFGVFLLLVDYSTSSELI